MFRIFNIQPYQEQDYKKRVEINSKGRRDYGYDYHKMEGVFRIVVTGDSFTWGSWLDKME